MLCNISSWHIYFIHNSLYLLVSYPCLTPRLLHLLPVELAGGSEFSLVKVLRGWPLLPRPGRPLHSHLPQNMQFPSCGIITLPEVPSISPTLQVPLWG